jgi:predicted Zn-dependent peptidase
MDPRHALRTSRLPSGLTVVSAHNGGARSVAAALYVAAGAAHEDQRQAGWAHLLEHLHLSHDTAMPEGLRRLEEMVSYGAVFNAHTDVDHTAYTIAAPRRYWREVGRRFADALRAPALTEQAIAVERQAAYREVREQMIPLARAHTVALRAAFAGTPFAKGIHDIIGGPEGPAPASPADLAEWRARHYTAGNACVIFAGAISHRQAEAWAQSLELPSGSRAPVGACNWCPGPAQQQLVEEAVSQSLVFFNWPTLPVDHPDSAAVDLISAYLGLGPGTYLFEELRGRRGLVYDIGVYHRQHAGVGVLEVHTETSSAGDAERVIDETRRLVAAGWQTLNRQRLARLKRATIGQFEMVIDDQPDLVALIGRQFVSGRPIDRPESVVERYQSVTLEQIQRVWRELLTVDRALVVRFN